MSQHRRCHTLTAQTYAASNERVRDVLRTLCGVVRTGDCLLKPLAHNAGLVAKYETTTMTRSRGVYSENDPAMGAQER